MKKYIYFSLLTLLVGAYACKKSIVTTAGTNEVPSLPATDYDYENAKLPDGQVVKNFINFSSPNGGPGGILIDPFFNTTNNILQITNAGASLGRVLFYDKKLSLNNTISCGSCHKQENAFADGAAISTGFEGRMTKRSSMAIANPITQNNLFWDSRSQSILDLSLRPVQNHIEMGMEDLDYLCKKLAATSYYPALYQKAFGSPEITKEKTAEAIAQFVSSITTSDSKFDEGIQSSFTNYTALEKEGMALFNGRAQCSGCHAGTNFSAPDGVNDPYGGGGNMSGTDNLRGTTNIGLDLVYTDNGKNDGNFKIPSLRNIALTAPYMHDGRFKTLNDVLNHYSKNIKPHKNLDVKFRNSNGSVKPIDLSEYDKVALIAFLNTLTDQKMLKDPKYSNPFQ